MLFLAVNATRLRRSARYLQQRYQVVRLSLIPLSCLAGTRKMERRLRWSCGGLIGSFDDLPQSSDGALASSAVLSTRVATQPPCRTRALPSGTSALFQNRKR